MNKWIRRDLAHIWHPYTQMKDCEESPPILIEKGRGLKLYDKDGNFYYDTISSWWCNIHGHGHPKIKEAIKKQVNQLEHVLFAGFTHKNAILFAEKLLSIAPRNLSRIFYSDNGSTAVETALKMSFQYWQNIGTKMKTRFVSLDHGYHGDTIGAMSVSGVNLFNRLFSPFLFSSYKVPAPYCYRCPMKKTYGNCDIECASAAESLLREKNREIAGFILEPLVMAAGGMIIYPVEYLRRIAAFAKKYRVHLILDEVATGFGRTGKMFACEYADIEPDFMCLSKGITSGYLPMGATLTTEKIFRAFYADVKAGKAFYHGHTYTANPISCAAGLASLEIFEKHKVLDRIRKLMPAFHESLDGFKAFPIVGDARYIGMIGALELVKDRISKKTFGPKNRIGLRIYKEGIKRHLILRPLGNIIYFYLPLCVKEKELKDIMSSAYNALEDVQNTLT